MAKRVVFTGKQQVRVETFNPDSVGQKQVGLRVLCSLMSTGTENIIFNRIFDPGTHWDRWVKYPFYPGYAGVARVEEIGDGVTRWKVGDTVLFRAPHASHHILHEDWLHPVPDGIDPKHAAWFALSKICSMGAKAAEYLMGDSVLIVGAGPIGQMSVRWAHALGCESVLVADLVEWRLGLARKGGATAVVSKPLADAMDEILAANFGQKPRVVIDTTGQAKVLPQALQVVADRGRVIVLGDTGYPNQQHLTMDVICRGISVVGAHDSHEDHYWNAPRIYRTFFNYIKSGRISMEGMNTHEFGPDDAPKAYELANTRRGETVGILFDWTKM